MKTFAKLVLEQGGFVKPLIIDSKITNGTGLFNPSLLVDGNKIYLNIRHCQYTLYHAELNIHEHPYGPLIYFNPENDITLTTTNYFGELNSDLSIKYIHRVDTSKLDIQPVWEFIGLEDGRIVKYDNKIYLCGVRRDTKPNGEGRMELSELEVRQDSVKEISRWRIPAPIPDASYCEKNWMPILSKPEHFVKWLNPVEIVKIDRDNKTCETVHLGTEMNFDFDPRGNGQVIDFDGGYLTLTHEVDLYRSENDKKDGEYVHRLCYWSKDWKLLKKSPTFSFMGAKIEFACGMAEYNGNVLITFGYQDNAAYILGCSKNTIRDIMDA
jgi:hypothetical protein